MKRVLISLVIGTITLAWVCNCLGEVAGIFKGVSFWATQGGRKFTASGGTGVLKNEKGEIVAEGKLANIEGLLVIKGKENASFVHEASKQAIKENSCPKGLENKYAQVELAEDNRWILKNKNFYFVLEIPMLNRPQIVPALDKSLARASMITLPKGTFKLWGYTITVEKPKGIVKFAHGKMVDISDATLERHPIFSVGSRDTEKAKDILEADHTAVNARDEDGSTPLHSLARIRTYEVAFNSNLRGTSEEIRETEPPPVAALLISKGAYLNVKDNKGATPLHWAVANGNFGLTKLLVEKGADVNAIVKRDRALEGTTPLIFAVANGDTKTMSLLISKGADVNKPDKKGQTPLHIAAGFDQALAAKLLLEKGATIDMKDNEGKTPLSIATKKDQKQIIELLHRYRAK